MSVANGKLSISMGVIDLPEANLCGFNVNDPSNSWVLDDYYSNNGISPLHVWTASEFLLLLLDETGDKIRELGHEYGTTTKRPRRCGWLDLVALNYAIRLNGITANTI